MTQTQQNPQWHGATCAQEVRRLLWQAFFRNATGLTPMLREKNTRLFEEYHAAVRIVYLETNWQENLRRNAQRPDAVPESVVNQMPGKLIPPEPCEARRVDWFCL